MSISGNDIVIVAALRTGIGNFNGTLASLPAHILGERVMRELLQRTQLPTDAVSEVILGQVLTGGCGQNPARQTSINAGLPHEVPAWLINQVCGSGLRSVALAAQAITAQSSQIVIAGGQENMSQAKHAMHLRDGIKMGDSNLIDMMLKDGLIDAFQHYHMGTTAENIAKEFNISREEQDQFAYHSQQKAEAAQKAGKFNDEIIPIIIPSKKGDITFAQDEFPRHGTTLESLAKLRPAFDKQGTVTAGNASGINDGAAMVLVMTRQLAEKYGLTPLAKIVSYAHAGVSPHIMGTGPIPAVKKALAHAQWSLQELDLIEANEAFASQAISVNKTLGWNTEKVNVNGGAIALGHPIGASGARILVTLLHEMKRQQAKKGIATLCIGGGMGVALCVERDQGCH